MCRSTVQQHQYQPAAAASLQFGDVHLLLQVQSRAIVHIACSYCEHLWNWQCRFRRISTKTLGNGLYAFVRLTSVKALTKLCRFYIYTHRMTCSAELHSIKKNVSNHLMQWKSCASPFSPIMINAVCFDVFGAKNIKRKEYEVGAEQKMRFLLFLRIKCGFCLMLLFDLCFFVNILIREILLATDVRFKGKFHEYFEFMIVPIFDFGFICFSKSKSNLPKKPKDPQKKYDWMLLLNIQCVRLLSSLRKNMKRMYKKPRHNSTNRRNCAR